MNPIILGALINDEHHLAGTAQQGRPIEDLGEDGGIAGGRGEMRVIQGAAQAALTTGGAGRAGEGADEEFIGEAGQGGGLRAEHAEGEQG